MRRFALFTSLIAALGLAAVGCGDDAGALPPGNMNIHWLVGSSGCEQAGVDTIAVFITGEGILGTDLRTFECEAETALLTGLPPGVYDLSLRGRDTQGVDRFAGAVTGVQVRSNGTTSVQTVRLSALPAELRVSWYFDNGRMCSYNQIRQVDIVLFEDEYEIYSATADCTLGVVELEDIQADTYMVDVAAIDDGGRARFNGQEEVRVDRGDRADVEIRLMEIGADRPDATE